MGDRAQLLNDAEEAMRLVLDGRQSSIWTAMPGIITAVDLEKLTCSVQPAIKGTVEDENGVKTSVNLPLLVNVPIVFPGSTRFLITFPLRELDEVLVVFASRCIDAWWQSGDVQRPMEARMHDLSDGFAIPGPRSLPKAADIIGGYNSSKLQIRSSDGNCVIELDDDNRVRIIAPGDLQIVGDISINGDLNITGAIVATGEITAAGIALSTHTHSSSVPSTPFTGNTGAPNP